MNFVCGGLLPPAPRCWGLHPKNHPILSLFYPLRSWEFFFIRNGITKPYMCAKFQQNRLIKTIFEDLTPLPTPLGKGAQMEDKFSFEFINGPLNLTYMRNFNKICQLELFLKI